MRSFNWHYCTGNLSVSDWHVVLFFLNGSLSAQESPLTSMSDITDTYKCLQRQTVNVYLKSRSILP